MSSGVWPGSSARLSAINSSVMSNSPISVSCEAIPFPLLSQTVEQKALLVSRMQEAIKAFYLILTTSDKTSPTESLG